MNIRRKVFCASQARAEELTEQVSVEGSQVCGE